MALPALRLTCTLHEDELVLWMLNGTEHNRLPVDDTMDAAEALELLEAGAVSVRLLWLVDRPNALPQHRPARAGQDAAAGPNRAHRRDMRVIFALDLDLDIAVIATSPAGQYRAQRGMTVTSPAGRGLSS